jgi:hypothetical protein
MGEGQSTEFIVEDHRKIGSQSNNLQMVCASPAIVSARVQREDITNFLLESLRQRMTNQINVQGSRLLGSLTIPGSIIHIDLAALGITSLDFTMSILVRASTSGVGPANNSTPDMREDRRQFVATFTRTPPITKVYCRKKLKGRTEKENDQLQQKRTPILSELAEDYTDHLDAQENSGKNTKKGKCNTPVSVKNLRRSSRLNTALDGHKPEQASSSKGPTNRSKTKGKRVASQSSLMDKILLPHTCPGVDFPGLSDLKKCAEMGCTYPEIPIVEIQKVATQKCRIAPSEVTAELLIASRIELETSEGRSSLENMPPVING